MEKEYITRTEFESLKDEVTELKNNMHEIEKLFRTIDKKMDVIAEKINNRDSVTDLKIQPIDKRVTGLEDNQKWLIRAVIGEVIAIVCAFIFK